MIASLERRAALACLYAGAAWGLFWIPLRALEEAGLHGLWITVVYFLVPTLCLAPIFLWRWQHVRRGGFDLQLTAMISGGALLLYAISIVYTDVVRAMLLFYLTPIWGTLLGRIILKESVTPLRIVAIVLAMIGMLTIFGLGVRFPAPQNVGDWMGLASGILWAIASVRLRLDGTHSTVEMTIGFFQWSLIFAGAAALFLAPSDAPSLAQSLPAMPLLMVFVLLLILPGTYAALWGPKFLSPGIVGLLFMTEIVVGSISAAWLSGEPFGLREMLGVALITGAGLLEPVAGLMSARATAKV
ncbi:MAG: DMT family transporter [Rhodospirillaceae bacterium]|nr:DMT family transporter [Rhodospirillaceae bacterium]